MKITKILIGIDDSTYAHHVAAYGFELARSLNAVVGLVHIVEPVVFQRESVDTISGVSMDNAMAIQETEMMEVQNEQSLIIIDRTIKEFGEGMDVSRFTQYGATTDGIIACGKEFDANLIIIGTHRRSGLNRLLMGSVAEHVVRYSEIPVLVVPFVE